MESFASVWDEAGRDAEADARLRSLTSARVKAAAFWPFLAAATSEADFENRFALAQGKVMAAATSSGIEAQALADSLRGDFLQLLASRTLHTVGSFYVETGDGEKVGGPYDTREAAKEAIDGGDVTGDGLKVAQGDGDDDSDKDDESDGATDDPDEDEGEDSGDDDNAEDAEEQKENPFAKKKSSKVAHNDAEVSQFSSERANQMAGEHHDDEGDEEYHGNDYGDDPLDPHYSPDALHEHDHRTFATLFPVVALQEGQDPLARIVQEVPSQPGEAEKEIHHGEYLEHPDNSLVNQFTSVYKKFAV